MLHKSSTDLHMPRLLQQAAEQLARAVRLLLADLEVDVRLPQHLGHVECCLQV